MTPQTIESSEKLNSPSEELTLLRAEIEAEARKLEGDASHLSQKEGFALTMIRSLPTGEQERALKTMKSLNTLALEYQAATKKLELTESAGMVSNIEQYLHDNLRARKRIVSLEAIRNKGSEDEKKIVEKRTEWNTLKASDVLFLKRKGTDLAGLLLVDTTDATRSVSSRTPQDLVGRAFTVNFGGNSAFDRKIGAGDILPDAVRSVEISAPGKAPIIAMRRNDPRPGFYEQKPNGAWRYIPVFDGYTISVKELGAPISEDVEASVQHFRRMREADILSAAESNPMSYQDDFTDLAEDIEAKKGVSEDLMEFGQRRQERMRKRGIESYESISGREETFVAKYGDIVQSVCDKFQIPARLLLRLFQQESKFNPHALNADSKAHGVGQIIPSTWSEIQANLPEERLDKYDVEDQILASAKYLDMMRQQKGCTWAEAVVYYHTGPGAKDSNVPLYLSWNPAVEEHYNWDAGYSIEEYKKAAAQYYGVDTLQHDTTRVASIPGPSVPSV